MEQRFRSDLFLAKDTPRHLQQAMDWDIIGKNPTKKVRKPKVPRRRSKVMDRAGFDPYGQIIHFR